MAELIQSPWIGFGTDNEIATLANRNDSATSFKSALAFAGKTKGYSDEDALKYVRTTCPSRASHLSESFELQSR